MKKVMLFIVSMLFAVSASAATLNISGGVGAAFPQNGPEVSQNGNSSAALTTFLVSSDVDTNVAVNVGGFQPFANIASMDVSIDGAAAVTITMETVFAAIITAGIDLNIAISNIILNSGANFVNYSVSVSAVPVPAALFLFAPALLGFLGLRRKATLAA